MRDHTLAAVVPETETEDAIAAFESRGCYDDTRKVVPSATRGLMEVPVTDHPGSDADYEIVVQSDPDYRNAGLDAELADRGWSADEIDAAPSSWAVVGDVILVRFPEDYPDERRETVADALLSVHGNVDTVLARRGIDGEFRTPDVEVVAGSGDTETVHVEHGTKYALDLSTVMFSPGNQAERARMGGVVSEGERVLDMFAGIGYFTLPMARAGAHVAAVEANPDSFRFLAENVQLNEVAANVDTYLGDCREVAPELDPAERVVLGYYDAFDPDAGYLDAALDAVASGGTLHVHTACPDDRLPDRPRTRLLDAAERAGRTVEIDAVRDVKSHSEGVTHAVLDVTVD
ncbi:class I SAM-dependent methyltransferase [Halocalculus aciditolerans]|uniref:tRNA(Phe) (4-demethylwyosine(37)-C(7)) aminocarboxypropyltransferase n=1 Tax=Halocalculus aciditolerans TaxID=1383812 RepID=A0A830EZP7_9EURY|nr:class I SAM-dependent methyltransferase family protein [Halocalculus aciditolerans]GGL46390.1 SAM-dependent methyltransferase [Halocalculus aciditolerans]